MRRQAAIAALVALAWVQVCPGPLLAKPTRTLARPSARRLIVPQPAPRATREHAAHPSAITRVSSKRAPVPERNASALRNHAAPARATRSRARTLAEERALAAQAAIVAADRAGRQQTVAESPRHKGRAIEAAPRYASAKVRDTAPSADIPAAPGEEANTPNNVGGALSPFSGLAPMKSVEEEATTPSIIPSLRLASLYDSRGRLVVPPPLYGSHEILLHQNEMADRDGLNRVRDDSDLIALRRLKQLVPLPDNETLRVDYRLPEDRRYSRPWTAEFLAVMARDFYSSFHMPLEVDSAVRTVAVQRRLLRTNGNAAPISGDTASPHLTGQAVDIAKSGLSLTQIAWMRTYLQPLIDQGKIDVEEEFQQACFHISVYRNFLPIAPTHIVAAARQLQPPSVSERPNE